MKRKLSTISVRIEKYFSYEWICKYYWYKWNQLSFIIYLFEQEGKSFIYIDGIWGDHRKYYNTIFFLSKRFGNNAVYQISKKELNFFKKYLENFSKNYADKSFIRRYTNDDFHIDVPLNKIFLSNKVEPSDASDLWKEKKEKQASVINWHNNLFCSLLEQTKSGNEEEVMLQYNCFFITKFFSYKKDNISFNCCLLESKTHPIYLHYIEEVRETPLFLWVKKKQKTKLLFEIDKNLHSIISGAFDFNKQEKKNWKGKKFPASKVLLEDKTKLILF